MYSSEGGFVKRVISCLGACLALVGGCCATALASSAKTAAVRSRSDCTTSPPKSAGDPLQGICDYLSHREGVVQVGLFDKNTGNTYLLSTGDATQYTASMVKVDILAKWLRHYQNHGVQIPDGIPFSIKYLMQHMIENSDNSAATALFRFGGGCKALTRFNKLIPMNSTQVGCESPTYYGWGNTITTAADQVALMKVFAYGVPKRVLGVDARNFGLSLMENIEPDQSFGISCGPWGRTQDHPEPSCTPPNYAQPVAGVTVALKNGWKTLPTCTAPIPECPWQVNSTGWVKGEGRDYVLTVLTTDDPVGVGDQFGKLYGTDTIQKISKMIWNNLG
jgi:hypothetical protein